MFWAFPPAGGFSFGFVLCADYIHRHGNTSKVKQIMVLDFAIIDIVFVSKQDLRTQRL